MAERNVRMEAVILSVKDCGESNRQVLSLSAEEGVVSSVLYGGPKSRLRSLVQPFNSGTLYMYRDESRNSCKITDFDAKRCRLALRESLFKIFASSLAAEIVIKTKCAGDSGNSFALISALLEGFEAVSETEARLGMLRFLWRYLGLLGIQPDVKACAGCGSFLLSVEGSSIFSESRGGFICPDCAPYSMEGTEQQGLEADVHALTYLAAINELPPGKVRSLILPAQSAYGLKRLLYHLAERSCGFRLETLEAAKGIL